MTHPAPEASKPRRPAERPSRAICPWCGARHAPGPRCPDCGGLHDDASRRATLDDLGPWQIRDDERPHLPGFRYERLVRLAREGRLAADDIVRGPTTGQTWAPARAIEGVAHLVGFCHACHVRVEPDQQACRACGAAFHAPRERDRLGVVAATAAAAVGPDPMALVHEAQAREIGRLRRRSAWLLSGLVAMSAVSLLALLVAVSGAMQRGAAAPAAGPGGQPALVPGGPGGGGPRGQLGAMPLGGNVGPGGGGVLPAPSGGTLAAARDGDGARLQSAPPASGAPGGAASVANDGRRFEPPARRAPGGAVADPGEEERDDAIEDPADEGPGPYRTLLTRLAELRTEAEREALPVPVRVIATERALELIGDAIEQERFSRDQLQRLVRERRAFRDLRDELAPDDGERAR